MALERYQRDYKASPFRAGMNGMKVAPLIFSLSMAHTFFRPKDLRADSPKVKASSLSSAEVRRLWEEPTEASERI